MTHDEVFLVSQPLNLNTADASDEIKAMLAEYHAAKMLDDLKMASPSPVHLHMPHVYVEQTPATFVPSVPFKRKPGRPRKSESVHASPPIGTPPSVVDFFSTTRLHAKMTRMRRRETADARDKDWSAKDEKKHKRRKLGSF